LSGPQQLILPSRLSMVNPVALIISFWFAGSILIVPCFDLMSAVGGIVVEVVDEVDVVVVISVTVYVIGFLVIFQ